MGEKEQMSTKMTSAQVHVGGEYVSVEVRSGEGFMERILGAAGLHPDQKYTCSMSNGDRGMQVYPAEPILPANHRALERARAAWAGVADADRAAGIRFLLERARLGDTAISSSILRHMADLLEQEAPTDHVVAPELDDATVEGPGLAQTTTAEEFTIGFDSSDDVPVLYAYAVLNEDKSETWSPPFRTKEEAIAAAVEAGRDADETTIHELRADTANCWAF